MTETRYWQRVGFRVTKEQALEMVEKMKEGVTGKVMDDEIDEYVNVEGSDYHLVTVEVNELFDGEDSDETVDEDNAKILALMQFEQNRKAYLKEKVAEGMEMADAKLAFDAEKGEMVRLALGLPEPEIEEVEEEE
jgi:hypothetical protein